MDNKANAPAQDGGTAASQPRRVIKRYSNRKLYDTKDSRYVTLLQIAEMVRTGEDVQIIDNNTKEDLTEVTLAQIIYEEQKSHQKNVPIQTLKELIHSRTEKVLHELREGPIGRFIPGTRGSEPPPAGTKPEDSPKTSPSTEPQPASSQPQGGKPSLVGQARETIEEWQHRVDERVKTVLANFMPWQQLQHEVRRLTERIEDLEQRLKARGDAGGGPNQDGDPK